MNHPEVTIKRLVCPVHSIDNFNADTRRVFLEIPAGEEVSFKAGQYLEIIVPIKKCPFSIASAPGLSGLLELHIRPTPGSPDSDQIEALLNSGADVEIEIPKGNTFVEHAPDGPLVLIAASTGITQMKSIVEHLLPNGLQHPVHLYWGVLREGDLYLSDVCRAWERQHPGFHYTPVVSEPALSPNWQGRTGLVGQVALADFDHLDQLTVFVSGGPAMVYATLDAFVERGLPAASMHSDIFSYAPRKPPA